ncbi:MAG: dihydropteroate synthase [Actinomycetota bacterium]
MILRHAGGILETDLCLVMGIVNRTPDSFFDGGRLDLRASIDFALGLQEQGADLLDLGGVRAGPGPAVSAEEETERLLPLVEALVGRVRVPLSIETGRPEVARAALGAGASILNDVTGLADPDLAPACAAAGGALVLMHHGGQIRGRPRNPRYGDVVAAVLEEWDRLTVLARDAGVSPDGLLFDPGLDFGKNTYQSLELMRRLDELVGPAGPVLVAPSRKDVVGETLDLPPPDRLSGTLALVALSANAGAAVVRVHDVGAAKDVVSMVAAVKGRMAPRSPVRGLWE